jgi:hypothetical protein
MKPKSFVQRIGAVVVMAAIVALASLGTGIGVGIGTHSPLFNSSVQAQAAQAAIFPNYRYPPMVFTATSQTFKQAVGGVSTGLLEITGTATACTLQIKVSMDGGTNYYATPYFAGVYTSNVAQIVTGAAFPAYNNSPVLYWVSLAGVTNYEIISSGTFTGTSCTATMTASGNKYLP